MILNRKKILIGLLGCAMVLGLSAASAAQQNAADAPQATLTEADRTAMDFIKNTNAKNWTKTSENDVLLVYDEAHEIYLLNERPVYVAKTDIPGAPFNNATSIKKGATTIEAVDLPQHLDTRGSLSVKSVNYWVYQESGAAVIESIVIK